VSDELYLETSRDRETDKDTFVRVSSLPFSAFVADKWGRRFAIFFGSCLMLCGVALQTAAQNIGMFIGARL
jgi:MFS family permease